MILEISKLLNKNNNEWDLTDDNGKPILKDEDREITDLTINKDSEACAVIPLRCLSVKVVKNIFELIACSNSPHKYNKCNKCGSRVALITGHFYYTPDEEPYQSGVIEPSVAQEGETWLGAYKCDECEHIQNVFTQ